MRPRNRNRVLSVNLEPSMTKQAPAQEVDINYIVKRYLKTGQMPPSEGEPQFGYVPSMDLLDAFTLVQQAAESFDSLPSAVRQQFSNSPLELLQAVEDPSQRHLFEELGMIEVPPIVDSGASGAVSDGAPPQGGEDA